MNVQLVQRLEGYERVHLVPEDTNIALCGATSASGWAVTAGNTLAAATCPVCHAALTTLGQSVALIPLSPSVTVGPPA